MRAKIRKALRFVGSIVSKIPTSEDPIYTKVLKGLAIVDTAYGMFPSDLIGEFRKERNLTQTSNRLLVDLFFSSALLDMFKKREITLEDYGWSKINALELSHKKLGELYFMETKYNSGEKYKKPIILHRPDFDFQKLMEEFWGCYGGKLHITFTLNGFSCSDFPDEAAQLYGNNLVVARDLAVQHLRYMDANISRSYLFLGEPGTGKSSCAMHFASKIGERILKIEAAALVMAGKSLRFLFEQLRPDFVLIDDIDKNEDVTKNMSSVLSSIEWLKTSNPLATIIFTANDISKLDKAFWRPGRVDSITVFDQPSVDDRIHIVKGFIEQFKVVLPEGYTVEKIVKETEGMSPVWLREIVLRFKYDDPKNVIATCRQMHRIVNGEPIKEEEPEHSNGKMSNKEFEEAAAKVDAASKEVQVEPASS